MFSQIDARVAYLLAVASGNTVTIANAAAVMDNGNAATGVAFTSGALFRDMGKTVTFVDAHGLATHRYRLVQKVNAADAEGVQDATEYMLVWAASGAGVKVVRTA